MQQASEGGGKGERRAREVREDRTREGCGRGCFKGHTIVFFIPHSN